MSVGDTKPLLACNDMKPEGKMENGHYDEPPISALSNFQGFTFFWGGFCAFIVFFMELQCFSILSSVVFPNYPFNMMSQSALSVGLLLATGILLYLGLRVNVYYSIIWSMIIHLASALALCSIVLFGNGNAVYYWLTIIIVFVEQCAVSVSLTGLFAVASVTAPEASTKIALGIAVSGLVAFIVSAVVSRVFTPLVIVSFLNLFAVFCVATAIPLLIKLISSDTIAERVGSKNSCKSDVECQALVEKSSRTRWNVFCIVFNNVAAVFITMVTLFIMYPTFCLALRPGCEFGMIILGLHNLGETLGRGMVSARVFVPKLWLVPLAISRICFICLFGLVIKLPLDHWMRAAITLYVVQVIQGFSMGAIMSSAIADAPLNVKTNEEKHLAGIFCTSAQSFGICMGSVFLYFLGKCGWLPDFTAVTSI